MTHVRRPNRRPIKGLDELINGGTCRVSGKVRYLDERTAEVARTHLLTRTADPERHLLRVYACRDCGDHHVGHDRSQEAADA